MNIDVSVTSRRASVEGTPCVICGNSDYILRFTLDAEWDAVEDITAKIGYIRNGKPYRESVPVSGGACSLPVISGAYEISVGLTGGNIRTAAPAVIPCVPCITDFKGKPKAPVHDVYNEIMEAIANA